MKPLFTIIFSLFLIISLQAQTETYNQLLQKHVDKLGAVDYKNLKTDAHKLTEYINFLKRTTPEKSWSANKIKAFWINAYNAYTLQLILENYPLKSIMKIQKKEKMLGTFRLLMLVEKIIL